MTVKYVKSGDDFRVYIVESYRVSGVKSPKSRTVMKLGLLSEIKKEHPDAEIYLNTLAKKLECEKRREKAKQSDEISEPLKDISGQEKSYAKGYHIGHMLIKKVWDELSLPYFFRYNSSKILDTGADVERAAFSICAQAISELGSQKDVWQVDKCFIESDISEFGNVMKMLDFFDAIREKLTVFLDKRIEQGENQQTDFLYTFPMIFECESSQSSVIKYSETPVLCCIGTSKDNRFASGDVITNGARLTDELFEKMGKKEASPLEDDKKTLENFPVIVSNRFAPDITDLVRIRESGLGYITYSRIKSLPRTVQNDILSSEGYASASSDLKYKSRIKSEEIRYNMQDVTLEEKYIYTYSQKRFKKERSDRLLLSSRTLSLYVQPSRQSLFSDDNESDKLFDGYRCIRSSGCKLSATEMIDTCRLCARFEDHARSIRSLVESRQTIAWNTKRIRGFFAFVMLVVRLLAVIETRAARTAENKITYDRIITAINDAKVIPVDKNGKVWKSFNISEDFRKISDALGVQPIPDMCTSQTLKKISGFTIRL